MTYTTLEALRLAEEAFMKIADLRNLGKINPEVIAFETLYTIRAARAQADHVAEANKMVGCAYCDNPLFAGTKCNNCGRVTLAEPVKQEPVAWVYVINSDNGPYEFHALEKMPKGKHHLYTTPPTAAQAARQMRDSVFTALLAAETPYTQMTMMQKKVFGDAIAALPVPSCASNASLEVQWRDLTDDEILNCLLKWRQGEYELQIARAVIAKFKELNT